MNNWKYFGETPFFDHNYIKTAQYFSPPYHYLCRGGSAWRSVGLIGNYNQLLGYPKVAGSNPAPGTFPIFKGR